MTTLMLLLWGNGLVHAILGGLNPGKVSHRAEHPYPVGGVLEFCIIITVESGLMFAIVRPFNLPRLRRFVIALAVFIALSIADYVFISGWTDQDGYCYSNRYFLFCAVCFLTASAFLSDSLQARTRKA